jgi:hypothetical protein
VSPTLTVLAITTLGVKAIKSSGLSMPASLMSLDVKTLMEIGTSCTFSPTFLADTTISSRTGSAKRFTEIKIKEKTNNRLSESLLRIYIDCLPGINAVRILYSKIAVETIIIQRTMGWLMVEFSSNLKGVK